MLTLTDVYSVQYGRSLDRLLREIVITDPKLGPVYMVKSDLDDRFCRIGLRLDDVLKLGLIFTGTHGG